MLSINLGNKGMDISPLINKAFYENDYRENNIDNILINRKFKELLANYIDIIDCKGSYRSLYNSLEWFGWKDKVSLYEIWKSNDTYFEKKLEVTLSEFYKELIYTHSKTTHISLVTLFQTTEPGDSFDIEKNPIVAEIERQWTNEELMVKISLLGAFFAKYFMPIHLDLYRASLEYLVFTPQVKASYGSSNNSYNFFEDTGVVDIKMDNIVTIGNIEPVAVGPDTMFGRTWENEQNNFVPIGVDFINDIDSVSNTDLTSFYSQLYNGIGVVIPVTVTVPLSDVYDGVSVETIYLYKNGIESNPIVLTDRKLFMSDGEKAEFTFNLLSTKEEKVSFSLELHSLSGHTWTACASYKAVDPTGSYLKVCRVSPKQTLTGDFVDNMNGNPWGTQYNTIQVEPYSGTTIDPSKYTAQYLVQYLPNSNTAKVQQLYHEIIIGENEDTGSDYAEREVSGMNYDNYWRIGIGPLYNDDSTKNHKYTLYVNKIAGSWGSQDSQDIINEYSNALVRHDKTHLPQLYDFNDIEESNPQTLNSYTFSGDDLFCIIPQFSQTLGRNIDLETIRWEFKNMSTLQTISYNIPMTQPILTNNEYKELDPGYWSITMYYRLVGSGAEHVLTKNSAFRIK